MVKNKNKTDLHSGLKSHCPPLGFCFIFKNQYQIRGYIPVGFLDPNYSGSGKIIHCEIFFPFLICTIYKPLKQKIPSSAANVFTLILLYSRTKGVKQKYLLYIDLIGSV